MLKTFWMPWSVPRKTTCIGLFAFGIPHIGSKAAKLLADHFHTMDAIAAATEEEICAIEGFGLVMAQSVANFFSLPHTVELLERFRKAGIQMTSKTVVEDTRFQGKTFVLTGTLPTMTRKEAGDLIERFGGKVSSSVSKKRLMYWQEKKQEVS